MTTATRFVQLNAGSRMSGLYQVGYEIQPSGCWTWVGTRSEGYGRFYHEGKNWLAHRLLWTWEHGKIPRGMQLDHICRNRACVNPAHLRVVTPRENVLAPGSLAPSAACAKQTQCKNGHPFDSANTYYTGRRRHCRACGRESTRRYYSRASRQGASQ